jgi:hypothetical protein
MAPTTADPDAHTSFAHALTVGVCRFVHAAPRSNRGTGQGRHRSNRKSIK